MNLQAATTHSSQSTRRLAHAKGMSLIEILVVLAIIGLVMGSLAFAFSGVFSGAQADTTKELKMGKVKEGVQMFMLRKKGQCPKSMAELVEAKAVDKGNASDAWGTEFQIKCPGDAGRELDIISAGADRQFGNEDDIKSWDEEK